MILNRKANHRDFSVATGCFTRAHSTLDSTYQNYCSNPNLSTISTMLDAIHIHVQCKISSGTKKPTLSTHSQITNHLTAKRQNSGQLGDFGLSRLILGHERIERQIVVLLLGWQISQAISTVAEQRLVSFSNPCTRQCHTSRSTHPAKMSFLLIGPSFAGLLPVDAPATGAENRSST